MLETNVYIYIAAPVGQFSPCKIGWASIPQRRIENLNCGREKKLEIKHLSACPLPPPNWGSSSPYRDIRSKAHWIEQEIHDELKLFRMRERAEWFDIEWESAAYVAKKIIEKMCREPT